MIRKISLLTISMLCVLASSSYAIRNGEAIKQADIDYKVGYRLEQHTWSIGNPSGTGGVIPILGAPNILSELIFEDVESVQARIEGSIDVGRSKDSKVTVHVRGGVSLGSIYQGTNEDIDYAGDDRTAIWIASEAEVEGDNTNDYNLSFGPKFYSEGEGFYFLPMFGYLHHEASYNMDGGVVTAFSLVNRALLDPLFGPYAGTVYIPPQAFTGLDSYYDTKVEGTTYGLEFGFNPTGKFRVIIGGEYYNLKYRGDGYWNLRDLGFTNYGRGDGYNLNAEIGMGFGDHWMLTLSGEYRDWTINDGVQYWNDGTGPYWQPFNGAESEMSTGMIGMQYNF